MTARQVLAAEDMVGESLVRDDRRGRLTWLDIIGRCIHALDTSTGDHRIWHLSSQPTSLVLRADGGALLGLERHICRWNWDGEPESILEVEAERPDNRLNEGAVGPDGAFWLSAMHQNIRDDDGPAEIRLRRAANTATPPTGRLRRSPRTSSASPTLWSSRHPTGS